MERQLLQYLDAMQGGAWGWVVEYQKAVSGKFDPDTPVNYPYLAGHYQGMLGKIIDLVGADKLRTLIHAHCAIAGEEE